MWESDGKGKPDTPAIVGVKSRLNTLTDQRMNWDGRSADIEIANRLWQSSLVLEWDSKTTNTVKIYDILEIQFSVKIYVTCAHYKEILMSRNSISSYVEITPVEDIAFTLV